MKKLFACIFAILLSTLVIGCANQGFVNPGSLPPAQPVVKEVPIVQLESDPAPVDLTWTKEWQPKVFFRFDKADLDLYSEKTLGSVAAVLMMQPSISVVVEGHADSIGSSEYNQQLSEKRAFAVKDFLVFHGIDPSRISVNGLGEEDIQSCKLKSKKEKIRCLQPARNATLHSRQ